MLQPFGADIAAIVHTFEMNRLDLPVGSVQGCL
jgi:hypothetical protein